LVPALPCRLSRRLRSWRTSKSRSGHYLKMVLALGDHDRGRPASTEGRVCFRCCSPVARRRWPIKGNLFTSASDRGTVSIHPSRVQGQLYVIVRFSWPSPPRTMLLENRGEIWSSAHFLRPKWRADHGAGREQGFGCAFPAHDLRSDRDELFSAVKRCMATDAESFGS
jgi:hypothetical protein